MPFACRCLQGQKKVPDLLELELQVVGSCLIGVGGTEPRCFARAARALNDGVISPAPRKKVLNGMTLLTAVLEATEPMIKLMTDLLSGEG